MAMDGKSTTRFQIGDIAARCPHCGAAEFFSPVHGEVHFVCATCRASSPRGALVDQIARDAIERTDALLRSARKPS